MHKNQRASRSKSQGKLREQASEINLNQSQEKLKHRKMNRRQFRLGKKSEQYALENKQNSYSRTRCSLGANEPKETDRLQSNINKHENIERKQQKQKHAQKYRSLLPDYLNARLSEEIAQLYKIADKLDKYLIRVSKKQMGQTFGNLQGYFNKMQAIELKEVHIKQINFVVPGYYNHYKDPLKNLVIEYPHGQNLHLRNHNFRKMLYETSKSMKAEGRENEPLQTRELYTKRTQFFYTDKHFRAKQQPQTKSQVPSELVNHIYERVDQQESSLSLNPEQTKPSQEQLTQIMQILPVLYQDKKINNMFRVTLISLIDEHMKCGLAVATSALKQLLQQESAKPNGTLHEHYINGRPIIGCSSQPHGKHP